MIFNFFYERAKLKQRQKELESRAASLLAPQPPCEAPDKWKRFRYHRIATYDGKTSTMELLPNGNWKTSSDVEVPPKILGNFMFFYLFPASFSKEHDAVIKLELEASRWKSNHRVAQ